MKLTVDHGAGCVDAKWLYKALCGACAMAVECVVKVIAVVRATGCWREREKRSCGSCCPRLAKLYYEQVE